MTELLVDGPGSAQRTLVLAHGAGGGMRTPFMTTVAREVSAFGIRVIRFEFPYMAGKKRRPDPTNVLLEAWRAVVREIGEPPDKVIIGGKSLGGRMASMIADEVQVRRLVCLGYPFHPPGRPEKLRTAHLETLQTPALIVQGTRDAFGAAGEVATYKLSPSIVIEWVEGGDHSFRKREYVEQAISAIVTFVTAD